MPFLPKVIAVIGPTASGKTDLGIALAKKFNGEVVNFDSRQIYQKMNIGTAKPTGEWRELPPPLSLPLGQGEIKEVYFVEGVPHHLMDFVAPDQNYSLANFKEVAFRVIDNIIARGKMPFLVGGTGLYFWGVIDNLDIPKVGPDSEWRRIWEKKPLLELVAELQKIDVSSAEKIDLKNPRRVLRALEVVLSTGKSFVDQKQLASPKYEALQIGLNWPREELYERINLRTSLMMQGGLLAETEDLVKSGLDWNLPSMSSIGYRQMGYYLRGEMLLPEAKEVLKRDTRHYAKKQLTWFKRDQRIKWIKKDSLAEAVDLVKGFL